MFYTLRISEKGFLPLCSPFQTFITTRYRKTTTKAKFTFGQTRHVRCFVPRSTVRALGLLVTKGEAQEMEKIFNIYRDPSKACSMVVTYAMDEMILTKEQ